ncbi:family 78 glycoside hydrolase catalytic domain [Lacisediminihabitans sp.]|uniref:family 78 glycoside hydrolase catalytic domain n=1 Tax=Lacisediminihabitans sp. TaxID=2787631 RepID=UPI00374DB9E4
MTTSPSPFTAISWSGHWIAPEQPPTPQNQIGFGGEIPPHEFGRVLYRRTFALDEVPATAPSRLTADSRYVLFVNGTEVGRGPIRSQPRRMRYDEHDLAPFLVTGENTIAILVTYYGHATAFWQPAIANGGLGTDALLVFEARLGERLLVSDDSWRVSRSDAWSTFAHGPLDGVPVESLDARLLPSDWAQSGFDDSGWAPSAIVSTTHIGGLARSQPPTDPFGALLPRTIGALGGDTVPPQVVAHSSVGALPPWTNDNPAERVLQVLALVDTAEATELPVTFDLAAAASHYVRCDFGRVVAGFVEFAVDAPAGTVIDLHYGELPFDPTAGLVMSTPRTGARYIARGSDDRFTAVELNGLRYLHLVIHAAEPGPITIGDVAVREYLYPRTGDSFFRSDDPQIDALYAAGIRTVDLNSFDAFTDCPTREQRAWVGDGVVHQMVHLATNDDWRLARNYITLGDSPRPDGMLPMSVVGEIEAGGSVTIPDWALHWVHGVYNLFRHVGDVDELLATLPTVERVLRWYEPYIDRFGTISDVPEWNLVDWASVFTTGRSSIVTALWARALAEFAEMSDFVENAGNSRWARARWEAARAGFEDFWDEERGTYVDHFVGSQRMPAASQAAGATAIVSGLAPRERWSRIADAITDEASLVVRSWIGGNDGGYDLQKLLDQSNGVQRIDWDVDTEIVLAEPFFSYVVHDAIAAAGRADRIERLIRRWSQFLVNGYDTFGECWGWGTPVHGWSSTPTRDLVSYVLGVTPGAPGFTRARIAPALGSLTRAEGSLPTPFGPIAVSIDGSAVSIESPVPVTFVATDGAETELATGRHLVSLG